LCYILFYRHGPILTASAIPELNGYVFFSKRRAFSLFGPPDAARKYFKTEHFAHIYNQLEPSAHAPNALEEAERKFRASNDYQMYVEKPLNQSAIIRTQMQKQPVRARMRKRGNPLKQFALVHRTSHE
jgi:hypothetical protein